MSTPTPLFLCLLLVTPSMGVVIDLSHVQTPRTFSFVQSYERVKSASQPLAEVEGVAISSSVLRLPEHSGTHIDVPRHFIPDGYTMDQIPVEWTIKEGVVVGCRQEAAGDRRYLLTVEKLVAWESAHGRIPNGGAVLVDFGWSDRFTDPRDFVGLDDLTSVGSLKVSVPIPSISAEAGAWLFHERDTRILGVDTLSSDPITPTSTFPNHRLFLANNRLLVENLKIPADMPARGFRFHATPPKFKDATGTQVRAFAMLDAMTDGACALQLSLIAALCVLLARAIF